MVDASRTAALPAARASALVKVARLYHEQGLRQPEIAARLHMSQSRISRMLKEAADVGIVRTSVVAPFGTQADLEERVRASYGLADVVVADTDSDDDDAVVRPIGAAAAAYLESTLVGGERIGVSSWSETLLALVGAMSPRPPRAAATGVFQLQGGVGSPRVQAKATRLVDGLAEMTGSTAQVFPVPGIVANRDARDALLADEHSVRLVHAWGRLDTALVGIGSLQPSESLTTSGNAVPEADQYRLRLAGAVGDVCLRFFDAAGAAVETSLDDRVLGIPRSDYRRIQRKVGVAGGRRKHEAIRAAALGGWIDVLITDDWTARFLVDEAAVAEAAAAGQAAGETPRLPARGATV